jgi:7-cyano-7-deazaguanine synthase
MAMTNADTKVLVMLSGGPDSAALAGLVARDLPAGHTAGAVYLRSGHHADVKESEAAARIAKCIGANFDIADITELLGTLRADGTMAPLLTSLLPFSSDIALAVMMLYAINSSAATLYVGYHRDDGQANASYSRAGIDRLETLAATGCGAPPRIMAPFLGMTKAEVLKLGAAIDVPYALTWSCMRADDVHCGQCLPCRARQRAFADAGLADPARYRDEATPDSGVDAAARSL